MSIHRFAVASGACASAASLFGKLTGLPTFQEFLLLRILFFGLMILCNAGVWTLYVKALQATTSSLVPTVISAASNYLLSAFYGWLVFGETTSILWWAGTSLIIMGLVFIITDQNKDEELPHKM